MTATTGFTMDAVCRAPAIEVFKILHDPSRIPDWWAGVDRVETGPDGTVTRYTREWPDFAYPTAVARPDPVPLGRGDGQMVADLAGNGRRLKPRSAKKRRTSRSRMPSVRSINCRITREKSWSWSGSIRNAQ